MNLQEKWAPVLDHQSLQPIGDSHKKAVIAALLENQERAIREERDLLSEASPVNHVNSYADTGGIAKFDPVLIALVRRSMPQLIAFDVCGVQPLKQPTGLIFAMRSKYVNQAGDEAFYDEADTDFSGTGTHAGSTPVDGAYITGTGIATVDAEALGTAGSPAFNEMAMTIEKVAVEAKTRALKAEYSLELAQDLKALHGLEAETELSNILSTEILAEMNREIIRTMYFTSKVGGQVGCAVPGTYDLDVDSNGRWSVERFKGLMFQIDREANAIARETRRGRGNFIICSSDVASALAAAGKLDYAPAIDTKLAVDEANSTYAGTLNGQFKVYVDPYSANGATAQFAVIGYKGSSAYDAGMFYCPYVPLQLVRAIDPDSFAPKIGFKTRYGLVANPFAQGKTVGQGVLAADSNVFFRRLKVTNLG